MRSKEATLVNKVAPPHSPRPHTKAGMPTRSASRREGEGPPDSRNRTAHSSTGRTLVPFGFFLSKSGRARLMPSGVGGNDRNRISPFQPCWLRTCAPKITQLSTQRAFNPNETARTSDLSKLHLDLSKLHLGILWQQWGKTTKKQKVRQGRGEGRREKGEGSRVKEQS